MPVSINFNGDSHTIAVNELLGFIAGMHTGTTAMSKPAAPAAPAAAVAKPAAPAAPAPAAPVAAAAAPAAAAPAPAAAAKAPAKGKGKAAAAAPGKPEAEVLERPTDEEATLDNARLWIQFVNQEKGLDIAAKIITSFGVKKVGDITDATKYGDFITKCLAALDGAPPQTAAQNVADMM